MGAGAEELMGQGPEPWERERGRRKRGRHLKIPREPLRKPTQRIKGRQGCEDTPEGRRGSTVTRVSLSVSMESLKGKRWRI